MSLQLNFEYPVGSGIASGQTEFTPGTTIGLLIRGGSDLEGFSVTIPWSDSGLSDFIYNGSLSLFGNANVVIPLPNVVTHGILVYQEHGLISNRSESLPIGVGTPAPALNKATNWYLIGGIAVVGAVGLGILARKLIK